MLENFGSERPLVCKSMRIIWKFFSLAVTRRRMIKVFMPPWYRSGRIPHRTHFFLKNIQYLIWDSFFSSWKVLCENAKVKVWEQWGRYENLDNYYFFTTVEELGLECWNVEKIKPWMYRYFNKLFDKPIIDKIRFLWMLNWVLCFASTIRKTIWDFIWTQI